jgi:hypothetical protein
LEINSGEIYYPGKNVLNVIGKQSVTKLKRRRGAD